MDVTPSLSYSITHFIFGILKSIDFQSVGLTISCVAHLLPFVNPSQKTMGEEIMVYDSGMIESREVANESVSIDEFLGCDNVVIDNLEESVLNDDPVGNIMLMIVMSLNPSCSLSRPGNNETSRITLHSLHKEHNLTQCTPQCPSTMTSNS